MQNIIGLFLISFGLLMAISETNFAAYKNRLDKKPIKRTIQKITVKKKPAIQTKASTAKSKKLVPSKQSIVTQKKLVNVPKTKKQIDRSIIVKDKLATKIKTVPISRKKTNIQRTQKSKGVVQSSQFIPNFSKISLSDKNTRQKKINQEMARIPARVESVIVKENIDSIVSKYPNVPADLLIDFIFTKGCGFYTNQGADQFVEWINSPSRDFIYRGDMPLDIETNMFTVKGSSTVYPKEEIFFFDSTGTRVYKDNEVGIVESSVKKVVNKTITYTRYYKKNAPVNPAFGEKFTIFYIYGGGYLQSYFSPIYDSVDRMLVVNGIADIVQFDLIDVSDRPIKTITDFVFYQDRMWCQFGLRLSDILVWQHYWSNFFGNQINLEQLGDPAKVSAIKNLLKKDKFLVEGNDSCSYQEELKKIDNDSQSWINLFFYFEPGINKFSRFRDIHQRDYTYEMAQLIWEDVAKSIKEYKKTHPEVKRTALMGFSFGGFNVANIATDKRYNGIVDKFMAFKGFTEWNKKNSAFLVDYAPTTDSGQRNALLSPRDKINDLKKPILFINSPDDDRITIESALDVWNSASDATKKLLFFYFDYFESHGGFYYEYAKPVFDIITSFLKNNKPSDPVVMQTRLYKALKLNTSVEGYVKTHERRSLEDLFVAKALELYHKDRLQKVPFQESWETFYEPLLKTDDFAGINEDQAKWMLKNSLNSLKKNRLKVIGHALRQEAERRK